MKYLEKSYKSILHLKETIIEYINFYNNKRIKEKLKGFTPVQLNINYLQKIGYTTFQIYILNIFFYFLQKKVDKHLNL